MVLKSGGGLDAADASSTRAITLRGDLKRLNAAIADGALIYQVQCMLSPSLS